MVKPPKKRAAVIGASKLAFDRAYTVATNGGNAQVDLIIRPAEQGPVWPCPPHSVTKTLPEGHG